MKLIRLLGMAAIGAVASSPAFAAGFNIDFENQWDYLNGDIAEFYNGGTAADGTRGLSNLGVSFTNVSGLSNDADFTYYSKAASAQGVAYVHDSSAFLNVASGVGDTAFQLSFQYSSAVNITGAVKAYSGLNGTGSLLGTIDLTANDAGAFDTWSLIQASFDGTAKSFDFGGLYSASSSSSLAAIDNISASPVPVPAAVFLLAPALAGLSTVRRRRA